jgi:hypothetical protein
LPSLIAEGEKAGAIQLWLLGKPNDHGTFHKYPSLWMANEFEVRIDLTDGKDMNFTPEE